ncbi:MAG: CotH kinase family protein [Bacilli bacterium]|nr:CotH kinase family protein [Bacilli bacterium]
MKNVIGKITCLMSALMIIGCAQTAPSSSDDPSIDSSNSVSESSQISSKISSSGPHVHDYSAYDYDDNNHWKVCPGCGQKQESAAHTLGEYKDVDLGTLLNNPKYKYTLVNARKCNTCNYFEIGQVKENVLPEFRVTYDTKDPNANFATIAKSTDVNRPTVNASFSITNCVDGITDKPGTIKVRGNQTAGFPKKGFTLKFESKINLLGLGEGQKFKKWLLMADAKDCTISRTSLGLTMSNGIIRDNSKVWASEYTPVSLYLNDQYWGLYFLAEQKEAKAGRIQLPEVEDDYKGTDIGYCFELDHYAEEEPKKSDGGDPTFTITYDGYENNGGWGQQPYDIESTLANPGIMTHFTMNSDITDGPTGTPINANNSNQVKFIQDRLTALFKVLKKASVDNKAYTIDNTNKAVAATGKTVRQAVEENFDLNAWAEGFIINAIACPPDVGYSSFYMSFDNSSKGDKKLRFDCPWDFDSNFGNRSQLCEGGDSGSKDPYYLDRTSNMWLQCLSKLDFFIEDYVKPLWNQVRTERVFENCVELLKINYKVYANEHKKNFQKWTSINPDDPNVSSYFGGELRSVFKQVDESNRKKAQTETINWFSKRVNYFEKKWGQNRPSLPTVK